MTPNPPDYSKAPKGTIVPSQLTPTLPPKVSIENGTDKMSEILPSLPKVVECVDCTGSLTGKSGFIMCFDGNPILANDYPTTGGPWAPAFTNGGKLVWVNMGG